VVLGIRRDGQKVLLAARNMGGESEAAWRGVLNDLLARDLPTPEFLIVDGAAGLEKALASLWPEVPTQRCTVHKHRNLLAHAPDSLAGCLRSFASSIDSGAPGTARQSGCCAGSGYQRSLTARSVQAFARNSDTTIVCRLLLLI
jgi:transposase-like protein